MTAPELVPIVGQAAVDASKPFRQAVGLTLSDAWQAVVGDKVQAWRLARAAEVSEKLSEKLAERGLAANFEKIPERFAYTWFDKATQEDEPEIQDLFAELMANAVAGDDRANDRRSLELVSRLTPEDAKLLHYLAPKFYAQRHWGEPTYRLDFERLQFRMRQEGFELKERALDSLLSLEVIRLIPEIVVDQSRYERSLGRRLDGMPAGDLTKAIGTKSVIYLTDLGRMISGALGIDTSSEEAT